jgi:NitT/TauT family transport system substrate-binding protein
MRKTRAFRAITVLSLAGLLVAACGDSDADTADTAAPADSTADTAAPAESMPADTASADTASVGTAMPAGDAPSAGEGLQVDVATCTAPTGADVKLQLQWFTQAQFAGYFAAVDQGFYEDAGLNVEIVEGGGDIAPQKTLASGAVDFAISWVPKALAEREAGAKVTNIAQIFQRSGTLQVSFKDADITSAADFAGKTIGNWGYGNEYEIFAALSKEGLDPASDVTLIQQNFDMSGLLANDIDAAEAMTYNEYAQVLEAINPDTGELYTADDLNVVSYQDEGVGMLQDAIWADQERLSDPAYCGEAIAFVKASIQGWAYCRDNVEACRDIVVAKGSTLGATHQLWQMNEVNKLVWPAEGGIGVIDTAAYEQTIGIASATANLDGATVLTAAPDTEAWTNDIVDEALAQLADSDVDVTGADYAPIEVTLTEGGV